VTFNRRVVAALTVILIATPLGATEFDAFDRRAQVRGSDVIVTGHVLSVSSDWNADHSAIVTAAEIAVDEAWKGACADRISVRTFGGRVANVALEVEGAARFEVGERVVLFLRRSGGAYTPYGMKFGKYDIVGSGPAALAVGGSPPTKRGERNVAVISAPLAGLRAEVSGLVMEEKR
jgi:hypothetical protein